MVGDHIQVKSGHRSCVVGCLADSSAVDGKGGVLQYWRAGYAGYAGVACSTGCLQRGLPAADHTAGRGLLHRRAEQRPVDAV